MLGIVVILGVCYLLSANRKAISYRVVLWGLGLQVALAIVVMKTRVGYWLLDAVSRKIVWFLSFAKAGTEFVFGKLGDANGGLGVIFAFQILPVIIFVASVFAVLYYLRVIPLIVGLGGKVIFRLLGASGAESLEVVASIVMDQTSAPLVIRPYLNKLTQSELLTIMTAGMAHISGAMLGAYVLMGAEARDLLTAVVMTAPGTILITKMLMPETGTPETGGHANLEFQQEYSNVLDAISHGVTDGLQLALTVAAMLVAFVALIALCNGVLGMLHTSLQTLFGYALAPVAWIIGVPWADARAVGSMMATKLVLNEFLAFAMLGPMKATISAKAYGIATYALCGFSNFGSIGIQIGAIGALAPSRKKDLARLGFRALLAATLANYLSASIAGIFLR